MKIKRGKTEESEFRGNHSSMENEEENFVEELELDEFDDEE